MTMCVGIIIAQVC